jgi:hypothetical protein
MSLEINCSEELSRWHCLRASYWAKHGIIVRLKTSEDHSLNKAVITFEGDKYLASVTAWGTGTVESIIFDLARDVEIRSDDFEFDSLSALREILDIHEDFYINLLEQGEV